jgi:hypothetical protein
MGMGTGAETEMKKGVEELEILTNVKERTYANCSGLVGSHVARLPAI